MSAILAIQVYELGERADELLAVIARALHVERLPTPTQLHEIIPLAVDDWEASYNAAEAALDAAGDDGRLIVRPLRPT